MKFKLSVISTALLTAISMSAYAEEPAESLEQITVEDTGIKQNGYQTTGTSVVSKAEVPVLDTPNTVNILSTQSKGIQPWENSLFEGMPTIAAEPLMPSIRL